MDSDTTMNAMATLALADLDDDDGVQQIDSVPIELEQAEEFYAVGRIVTDKPTKYVFFRDTMAGVWRPEMGMNVKELPSRRFLFRFYNESDISRGVDEGSWSFEQNMVILKRLACNEDPYSVSLDHAHFWVQVHGLPVGHRSEAVLNAVGGFVGRVVNHDERNFDGSMRLFFRIRLELEVAKALKKGMKLRRDSDGWVKIEFRYERLPTFCFICGLIGHGDRFCPKKEQGWDRNAEKPFGPELRAGGRRNSPAFGHQWVASETTIEQRSWNALGSKFDHDPKGKNPQDCMSDSLVVNTHGKQPEAMHGKSTYVMDSQESNYGKPMCMNEMVGTLTIFEQKRKRTDTFVELESPKLARRHRSFLFENAWLKESGCNDTVLASWNASIGDLLPTRLDQCGAALKRWGGGYAKRIHNEMQIIQRRLTVLRERRDVN
nr:uncharacterized protein LOC109189671 [Ipomoea batatas]